jgi:hypothetical protein
MSQPPQAHIIKPDEGFFAKIQYHQNIPRDVMLELVDLAIWRSCSPSPAQLSKRPLGNTYKIST